MLSEDLRVDDVAETKRCTFTISLSAVEALRSLTSERKQGEYISALILDALAGKNRPMSQPGILERIEEKLDKVLAK